MLNTTRLSANLSTNYYRKNRITKMVCHKCPHEGCNYQTFNSKNVLTNHINSRHVAEKDRPFQCDHCERGFAQKAHLVKHIERGHEVSAGRLKTLTSTIMYLISVTDVIPSYTKTRARREYYQKHSALKGRDIFYKKHEYLEGHFLKNHDLHYDRRKGFITFKKVELKTGIDLKRVRWKGGEKNKRGRFNY